MLQNNLRGGEILFEIEKPRRYPSLLNFKQDFDTEEVILQQPQELFYHDNKLYLILFLYE